MSPSTRYNYGHVHQIQYNQIGNISFHAVMATAWRRPYPESYAPAKPAIILLASTSRADEFTNEGAERWQKEFMSVVQEGRALWGSGELGTNGVACGQCHPNAANTHPETYPKFQQQLGRVATLREMINGCLQQPLEGEPLALDDPKLVAMEAYVTYERRGVALDPGKH